ASEQQLYTCPACGTELYEKCDKCSDIRHSLLPFCEHCGNEKANWS
ncbi:MAG: double zinc ribbon domain-containing protein, partial [Planctomycetota bacterium]